mgnify:CR=1 FL=1
MEHNSLTPSLYSLYAHLDTISPNLAIGSKVTIAQVIGKMGNSSSGYRIPLERSHLHFEMGLRLTNKFQNWYKLLWSIDYSKVHKKEKRILGHPVKFLLIFASQLHDKSNPIAIELHLTCAHSPKLNFRKIGFELEEVVVKSPSYSSFLHRSFYMQIESLAL